MRKLLLPLVLALSVAAIAEGPDKWTAFKSAHGKFSATYPGTPKTSSIPIEGKTWKGMMHFTATEINKNAFFATIYVDFPADRMASRTPTQLLDLFTTMFVRRTGTQIGQEKKLFLKGVQGREITVRSPRGETAVNRMFLVKNRVYMVSVGGRGSAHPTTEGKRFLDSFRIF